MPNLVDRYGRRITDLRISVTARCNFHCVYCHNEGQGPVQPVSAPTQELTAAELERIVRVASDFGIGSVKLSGGEPLLRDDLEEIIAAIAPHARVSLVTNGSLLERRAASLAAAGLSRINVSLDSTDAAVFREVRRGPIRPVIAGIDAALAAGIRPVKLNMVVFEKTIDEIDGLLELVRSHDGLTLQLIEYMPEIVGEREHTVDIAEVKAFLAERSDRVEVRPMHHRRIYHLTGARVEVVDPVGNAEFCGHCERLRLTADGHLKGCLNRDDDLVPIRGLVGEELAAAFRRVTDERIPYYPHVANGLTATAAASVASSTRLSV